MHLLTSVVQLRSQHPIWSIFMTLNSASKWCGWAASKLNSQVPYDTSIFTFCKDPFLSNQVNLRSIFILWRITLFRVIPVESALSLRCHTGFFSCARHWATEKNLTASGMLTLSLASISLDLTSWFFFKIIFTSAFDNLQFSSSVNRINMDTVVKLIFSVKNSWRNFKYGHLAVGRTIPAVDVVTAVDKGFTS